MLLLNGMQGNSVNQNRFLETEKRPPSWCPLGKSACLSLVYACSVLNATQDQEDLRNGSIQESADSGGLRMLLFKVLRVVKVIIFCRYTSLDPLRSDSLLIFRSNMDLLTCKSDTHLPCFFSFSRDFFFISGWIRCFLWIFSRL
jgi:hypothetical protein